MKLNWNFWRCGGGEGGGVQSKSHPWEKYASFLEPHNLR